MYVYAYISMYICICMYVYVCICIVYICICIIYVCMLSHSVMSDSMILWTVAHQAPLSMEILQARILEWVAMPSSIYTWNNNSSSLK